MPEAISSKQKTLEISEYAGNEGFSIRIFLSGQFADKIHPGDYAPLLKELYTMSERIASHTPVTNFTYWCMQDHGLAEYKLCAIMFPGSDPRILISEIL